jgi:signal transduction histidine kinase
MDTNAVPSTPRPDLRRSVFLPLAGAIILLFLALGFAELWTESRSETDRLEREVDAALRLFELRLGGDVETMQVAMEPMLSDPAILTPFMAGDREALLETVQARFDTLRTKHGISHMYFVGADRVTFLRVHQPDRLGDVIDRFTMREAQRTEGPSHGLELGPLGTLTLRVVTPLRHEGRIVGYLELGREVEHYARDIRNTLNTDLHVFVSKDLLVREQWAEGQAMLGREANWERFHEFVATDADTGGDLGPAFDEAVPLISQTEAEPARVELGDGRHLAVGARPLLDASDREVGLLVVSLDVTKSELAYRRMLFGFLAVFITFAAGKILLLHRVVVRAEQGLRRAEAVESQTKAELEQRVRERTAALEREILEREKTEAQLRQAQKMEVIGQLTGGVAHDFNNLLAIIMADLEVLRDQLADDGLEELIAGAWEATERGAALIARLLAVSRRQPLSPHPVDLNELVAGLMPLLERAVTREIVIEAKYGADLWKCFVDPAQLENLVLNLVVNARDAMPEEGTLTIETSNRRVEPHEAHEWEIEPGNYVELTVADTGAGMPREVLERAFDPFFTTKEVGKGTGLGLSMVHGTAKQSGGHVELESTPGVGTTVRLLLPQADGARTTGAPGQP